MEQVDLPLDQGAIHQLDGNLAGINPSADDLNRHGHLMAARGVTCVPATA
jgi:hypothetical protein